jgi:hypothetical protein
MSVDIDQRTISSPSLTVFTRNVASIGPVVTHRPEPLPPPVWSQGPFFMGRDGKPVVTQLQNVITPQAQAQAAEGGSSAFAKPGREDFAMSSATLLSLTTRPPGVTAPPEYNQGSGA